MNRMTISKNSLPLASPPQVPDSQLIEPRYCQNCKDLLTCNKNVQGFPTHCMKSACRKAKAQERPFKSRARVTVSRLDSRPCLHCQEIFAPDRNPKTSFCPLVECQAARIRRSRQMQVDRNNKWYHGKNPDAKKYVRRDSKIIEEVKYYSREELDLKAYKLTLSVTGNLINSKAYLLWRAARKMAQYHGWKYSSLQNDKSGPPRTYVDPFWEDEKEFNPKTDKLLASALADPEIMTGRESFPPYKGLIWKKIKESIGIPETFYQNTPAPGGYLQRSV